VTASVSRMSHGGWSFLVTATSGREFKIYGTWYLSNSLRYRGHLMLLFNVTRTIHYLFVMIRVYFAVTICLLDVKLDDDKQRTEVLDGCGCISADQWVVHVFGTSVQKAARLGLWFCGESVYSSLTQEGHCLLVLCNAYCGEKGSEAL
jgi:hypothetical protein